MKEYKSAFYLTVLILVVFAGGSILMTLKARQKNSPPVNPPALTLTPSPAPPSPTVILVSLTPSPKLKISLTPAPSLTLNKQL